VIATDGEDMNLLLLIVAGLLLAGIWRSHHTLARSMQGSRTTQRLPRYPSVTVIRPIRGLDAGEEDNVRAALDLDYPSEVQTLFVFDDPTEPAVPIVERVLGASPHDARIVYCGRPPEGRTGKLNAMIEGLRQAKGELIAFADSDIRPDRDVLRVLAETLLNTEGAGAAFTPVVVTEPARTAGDVGYALLLNGLYGPAAAQVARANGGTLSFIMGQFMMFKRDAIAAIGGLETAEGQLVDDMYLGQRLNEAGYLNAVAPRPVPIIQYGMSLGEFAKTYLRWLTFSRSGLPGRSFKLINWLRGAQFWLGLAMAAVALVGGWWWAAAANAAAALSVAASINLLHRRIGGAPLALRHLWVSCGLLLTAPLVIARMHMQRELDWRGRRYSLNPAARLAR
jgi:ceramide glucosyltransferase